MSIFGLYSETFLQKLYDDSYILSEIGNSADVIKNSLLINKYTNVKLTDEIKTLLSTFSTPLVYEDLLFRTVYNNGVKSYHGFNSLSIRESIYGDPSILLKQIDESILNIEFFKRSIISIGRISKDFYSDLSFFNSLININDFDISRYTYDLLTSNNYNYLPQIYDIYDQYDPVLISKSGYLYIYLYLYVISSYNRYPLFSLLYEYTRTKQDIIYKSDISDSFSQYILSNSNISKDLYRYIINNNFLFYDESLNFITTVTQSIIQEILNKLPTVFSEFLSTYTIIQHNLLNDVCQNFLHNLAYNTTTRLYKSNTISQNYISADFNYFRSTEQFVSLAMSNFIDTDQLDALQKICYQYKDSPLFFINVFQFVHNYWINYIIRNNKNETIASVFQLYSEKHKILQILFDKLQIENINPLLQQNYNDFNELQVCTKTAVSQVLLKLLYDFIDSSQFKDYLITDFLPVINASINNNYLYSPQLYQTVDAIKIFFKVQFQYNYFKTNDLFSDYITKLSSSIWSIIKTNNLPNLNFADIKNELLLKLDTIYNIINNYSFCCKINEYVINSLSKFKIF